MTDFTSSDDIISVSDICDRVEELRGEKQDLIDAVNEACEAREADPENEELVTEHHAAIDNMEDWIVDTGNELEQLEELLSSLCGYGGDHQWNGDWYPATLISENYFEQAMDSDMEEFGYVPKDLPAFLTITVDYDALKQDYSEVEFDGTTYYYR